ncbi:hypothetical protein R1sor_026896 [Riccia sorocarpa]|uniref:Uncharacterized protein n=1 Tax=Riccia sorocarpa TaxID=122646 RepID=A0ABD3GCN4_9MARC
MAAFHTGRLRKFQDEGPKGSRSPTSKYYQDPRGRECTHSRENIEEGSRVIVTLTCPLEAICRVADYCCLSSFLGHLYVRMGEDGSVPSYFLEADPKKMKKQCKLVIEDTEGEEEITIANFSVPEQSPVVTSSPASMEAKIDAVLANLTSTWKKQALQVVPGALKVPLISEIPPTTPQSKTLRVTNLKLQEIAQTKHEQLTALSAKYVRMQEAFCELETSYGMRVKAKEFKEFIFAKYVDTLKSKIEDVTRILELESLLESKGVTLPKKKDLIFAGSLTEILHAQLEELSQVLLVGEDAGPTADIDLSEEYCTSLLAHIEAPPDLATLLGE